MIMTSFEKRGFFTPHLPRNKQTRREFLPVNETISRTYTIKKCGSFSPALYNTVYTAHTDMSALLLRFSSDYYDDDAQN